MLSRLARSHSDECPTAPLGSGPSRKALTRVGFTISWLPDAIDSIANAIQGLSPYIFGAVVLLYLPINIIGAIMDAKRESVNMETTELRFQTQQINAHRNRVERQTNHLGVARDSITCLVDEAHQLVSSHADIAERLERVASDGAALAKYADKHEKPLGTRGIQKALGKLRTGKPDSGSRREPSRQKDYQRYHNMLQGVKRG